MRKALLAAALAVWTAPAAHAAPAGRTLYAGDWTGQMEIFAVDPSGKAPPAQIRYRLFVANRDGTRRRSLASRGDPHLVGWAVGAVR
jgi:hypothetical protein